MNWASEKNNGLRPWEQVQAIYVHVPFCVQKCLYCDFVSYACHDQQLQQDYVDAVCREIALRRTELSISPQATIYFGGGTPSVLRPSELGKITAALKEYGYWQQPAEATIEVNPGTAALADLEQLRAYGFDRISFGVQSLHNAELRSIGRIHTAQQALEAVALARQAGFERINADIMYGLPGQTLASLRETLAQICAAGAEHLSVYGLILEEGTPLTRLVEQGKVQLPDEDLAADMYEMVQDYLQKEGFERYEVSNYARDKRQSQHNLAYWRYLPYEAFGAAACAFDGRQRRTGTEDVRAYIAGCRSNAPVYHTEVLTDGERLSEFMFMNLRKTSGVDLAAATERFDVDVKERYAGEIAPLVSAGLLTWADDGRVLRLTERGMELGNQVFEVFVTV